MAKFGIFSVLSFIFIVEIAAGLPQGNGYVPRPDLKALLTDPIRNWSINTTVSFPDSPTFKASTERWTIADPPTYIASIRPGAEEDISKVVNLARAKAFPFLTRGAGHGYAASLGTFDHGLSLDLSQWKTMQIDKRAQTLTVGPGVTFAEIFDPLFKAGFYIQTGSCSCPSVIGVTIGGGIGRLMGKLGLLMDALQSVRMVGADGKVITVSATSHPDLWWGVLGAGANFGVITSATYKVHPLVDNGNSFVARFLIPKTRSREYFDMIEANYSNTSANLAQITVTSWNKTTESVQLVSNWVYYGPEKEARNELVPVFNFNATSTTQIVQWNQIISSVGFDKFVCQPNQPRSLFSLNQKIYSADGYQRGFEKVERYLHDHPGGRDTTLVYENFPNQAVTAIPDNTTAFAWRDFKGFLQINFAWAAGDEATAQASNKLGKELRNQFTATSGYSEMAVFVNYARGDESLENIYGKRKLPRLTQLKKKYDPYNLFAYNHPLPMHYP